MPPLSSPPLHIILKKKEKRKQQKKNLYWTYLYLLVTPFCPPLKNLPCSLDIKEIPTHF